jgi:primosomal protein N' (replication factor Y)
LIANLPDLAVRYALVLLDAPDSPLPVSYEIPEHLREAVRFGVRVAVPLGRRRVVPGFVVGFCDRSPVPARAIRGVLGPEPLFDEAMWSLAQWVADRYLCTPVEALRCAIPPEALGRLRRRIRLQAEPLAAVLDDDLRRAVELVRQGASEGALRRAFRARAEEILRALQEAGWIRLEPDARLPEVPAERVLRLAVPPEVAREVVDRWRRRAPRRAGLLERLLRSGEIPRAGVRADLVRDLVRAGLVVEERRPLPWDPFPRTYQEVTAPVTLTPEQEVALGAIRKALRARRHAVFLLFGVTGSGKTEVYLQAAEEAIRLGRQVLVLVPEISLTPQTVARFAARFGERVAVLHSRLGAVERLEAWRRIRDGACSVVIGPRSAVFAPLRNLGLVVVDEEHEASYKQQEQVPRYHAREVALERARRAASPVLLGSATPSVESYWRAREGTYHLLPLPRRILDRPLPSVRVVDMRKEQGVLSATVLRAMRAHLEAGDQVLLYLNRRGYAAFLLCRDCGEAPRCRRCDVAFTYHLHSRTLRCHYCGRTVRAPSRCSRCGGVRFRPFGPGTQRVEEEVRAHFPDVAVARADRDTMQRRGAHERLIADLQTGRIRVLVGTQIIAKGLDLPGVGLVGVVAADVALSLPDFRAAERTFQQLAQVAGRAGRGDRPGEVLIQTYRPDHPAIRAAAHHDYLGFFEAEIASRRVHLYPPFTSLVSVIVAGRTPLSAERAARAFAEAAAHATAAEDDLASGQSTEDPEVLGPSPAPFHRLRGWYRWQVVVRSGEPNRARERVREALRAWQPPRGVRVVVDVDPVEML